MPQVHCLSIRQPHADNLIYGSKRIENRTWATKYRGRLYVHASKLEHPPDRTKLEAEGGPDYAAKILSLWKPTGPGVTGAIIGSVQLIEIIDADDLWILSETQVGAKKLSQECAATLRPSQREGFLDRWRAVHPIVAGMTADEIELHGGGPLCWILLDPQPLKRPIATPGKLNLWTFDLPAGLAAGGK